MMNNLILFNLKKKLKIIYVCMMDVLKFWFDFNIKWLQILYICMMDVLKGLFFNIKKKENILKNKFKKFYVFMIYVLIFF